MKKTYTLRRHIYKENIHIKKIYTWKRHGRDIHMEGCIHERDIHIEGIHTQRGHTHKRDIYTKRT